MPPLDEDGLGAHIEELARGDVYVLFGVDLHVREQFRFGAVGRQEIGLGQNVPAQGIDRILAEEPLGQAELAAALDPTGYRVLSAESEPCRKKGLFGF